MRITAAIFDLDGTILDTLGDLAASTNAALVMNGMPERSIGEVRAFVGNGIARLIASAVPEGTSQAQTDRVLSDFRTHYAAHCADRTCPYEGIPELLRSLRDAGLRTAVVSNKADFAVQTLVKDFFPGLFDVAVGEREGVRRKPAPDTVEAVLTELGLRKEECIYIGDSEVDVQTARNAGMPCVTVLWGFRDREELIEAGAERIVSTVDALRDALLV